MMGGLRARDEARLGFVAALHFRNCKRMTHTLRRYGRTPLKIAIYRKRKSVIKYLSSVGGTAEISQKQ